MRWLVPLLVNNSVLGKEQYVADKKGTEEAKQAAREARRKREKRRGKYHF